MLPWLELVIFGMLFGKWLRADEKKAYQKGLWIGLALLVSFVIIRYADGFGNIRPRAGRYLDRLPERGQVPTQLDFHLHDDGNQSTRAVGFFENS